VLIVLSGSCGKDGHRIVGKKPGVEVSISRFDRELFQSDPDTLPATITWFYRNYDDFLDVFSYYVIGIGTPSSRDYQANLTLFINDRLNREVFNETQKIFPDLRNTEREMGKAFSRFRLAFPEDTIPRIVAYISRFNNPYFTVGNYIGLGLDRYFGVSSDYYTKLQLPQYIKTNMFPEKIPSDLLYTWASVKFPFNDSPGNVLGRIIYEGKLLYFCSELLPKAPDSLIIGYTKSQMKWVKAHEEQMWTDLVEKKILFSSDPMDIRKLTGPAPFTYFFSAESPGRAGSYIGWRIFTRYAERSSKASLQDLMKENDYEKILRVSAYNP
jgi:hypothetical protein